MICFCSGVYVEVAEWLEDCCAEVGGKFNTNKLTARTLYKLAFVVKFTDHAFGLDDENLLILILLLPNCTKIDA